MVQLSQHSRVLVAKALWEPAFVSFNWQLELPSGFGPAKQRSCFNGTTGLDAQDRIGVQVPSPEPS